MRKYLRKMAVGLLAVAVGFPLASTSGLAQEETPMVDELMAAMTIEEKVTQTIMPDFRNWVVDGEEVGVTELNEDIKQILQDYQFGGVILFAENVVETEQTARLVHQLQSTMFQADLLPLLIGIDQEGGIVNRLGTGTQLPGNMALGATGDPLNSQLAGEVIGAELQALGINVNFAPVIDVNNNPKNPVIGLRSFSSDPAIVAEHGLSYMDGIKAQGVATAAKHFPGHGDTETDSHVGLPVVDKSLEELQATELIPFKATMDNDIEMLMTAHIQFPQLETETVTSELDGTEVYLPATLSKTILTDLAREEMGYEGIIVTDALNMEAISENFGEVQAAILSKQAGADILLMPTIIRSNEDIAKLDELVQGLVAAVENGDIPIENLDDSVRRILTLKDQLGLLDGSANELTEEERIDQAVEMVGSDANREAERQISSRAITLLANENNALPLAPGSDEKVVFVTANENQIPGTEFSIERMREERKLASDFEYEVVAYGEESTAADFAEVIEEADYVVVYTSMVDETSLSADNFATAIPQEIFTKAKEAGKTTVQVSVNKPYDAVNFADVDAVLLSYGYNGMDPTEGGAEPETSFGPNIPAAVEVIFGVTFTGDVPSGVLPVDLPVIEDGVMSTDEFEYEVGYRSDDWTSVAE